MNKGLQLLTTSVSIRWYLLIHNSRSPWAIFLKFVDLYYSFLGWREFTEESFVDWACPSPFPCVCSKPSLCLHIVLVWIVMYKLVILKLYASADGHTPMFWNASLKTSCYIANNYLHLRRGARRYLNLFQTKVRNKTLISRDDVLQISLLLTISCS